MALAKKSSFEKTLIQINVITDDEDARAIQHIIEAVENILYVLSIVSLMILYVFEFIHYLYLTLKQYLTSGPFAVAWEFGIFSIKVVLMTLKLLSSEGLSWLKQGFSV